MATKRGFRVNLNARSPGTGPRRRRVAIALAGGSAICLLAASPALADVGGVYFDANANAAAGDPNNLFNGSFTGVNNVGIGQSVMKSLTSGSGNTALGSAALFTNTSGGDNTASGT